MTPDALLTANNARLAREINDLQAQIDLYQKRIDEFYDERAQKQEQIDVNNQWLKDAQEAQSSKLAVKKA